jgi:hypothetical protein
LLHRNRNRSLSQAVRLPVKQPSSGSAPDRLLQHPGVNRHEYGPDWFLPFYHCWTMPYDEPAMQYEHFHP